MPLCILGTASLSPGVIIAGYYLALLVQFSLPFSPFHLQREDASFSQPSSHPSPVYHLSRWLANISSVSLYSVHTQSVETS